VNANAYDAMPMKIVADVAALAAGVLGFLIPLRPAFRESSISMLLAGC